MNTSRFSFYRIRSGWRLILMTLMTMLISILPLFSLEERTVTLQLPWLHQFQFAGYYAALDQGYYKDSGLNVVIKEGAQDINPVDDVLSGKIEFGVSRSELLLRYLEGDPIIALAVIFQHSPDILLSKRSLRVERPIDLIDRNVMLLQGNNNAIFITTMIKEGIPLDKIKITPSSYNIDDLVNDKVDVFHGYTSNEPFYLQSLGIEYNIIKPITYGVDFYGDTLFTSREVLKKHKDTVEKMREASLKGWEYAFSHKDEIISLILEKYSQKKSALHLRFEADEIEKLVLPLLVEPGHMNSGRWTHMAETYVELGMASSNYNLDDFIFDPDKSIDAKWVKWLIIISILLIVITIFSGAVQFLFNKKLKKTVAEKKAELLHEIQVRKLAEEMLIQNEKMVSIGGLAAGMAHEINNPLAGIVQSTLVLSRRLNPKANIKENEKTALELGISLEHINKYMEKRDILKLIDSILDAGKRASSIVSNMLDFTRRSNMKKNDENIAEIIDQTLELASTEYDFKKEYDFKNIEIIRDYEENIPLIKCEKSKLQQVFLNLFRNSAQAMSEDQKPKRLTIRTKMDPENQMCTIEITDNGPGMDKEKCRRIFEPFFTTKAVGVGTGLGLSVSYFIITEDHSGQMYVMSEVNKGTSIFIKLPVS